MSDIHEDRIKNSVLIGLDEYLFLFDGGQKQFAYLTGELKPTDTDIKNFIDNITQRKIFCDSKEIPYLHVVFPSKPIIMKEKVPEPWQAQLKSLFLSHYGVKFGKELPEYISYPKHLLLTAKEYSPVYRVSDTHLTSFGSLVIARDILNKFGANNDIERNFFELSQNIPGDLAQMLQSEKTYPEKILIPILTPMRFDNREALPSNTHNVCIITNPTARSKRRLLIFGDSFSKGLLDYLSVEFHDIFYIRSPHFQTDIIELFCPDAILTSNAERYLSKVTRDDEVTSLMLALSGLTKYCPSDEFKSAYQAQLSFRHYPHTYKYWLNDISNRFFDFGSLGVVRSNEQITPIDKERLAFTSTGNDPYFSSYCPLIRPGNRYVLCCDIMSEVHSIATVYFTDVEDARFSELRTISIPVSRGENRLRFKLDYHRLGQRIRLDPLCCPGNFQITNITIFEDPEYITHDSSDLISDSRGHCSD